MKSVTTEVQPAWPVVLQAVGVTPRGKGLYRIHGNGGFPLFLLFFFFNL